MANKNTLNSEIGVRIQSARKAAGLTQMAFSEQIGVSTQYISDLERGIVGASIPTIIKICNVLNVPTDYILRGQDPTTGTPTDLLLELNQYTPEQQRLILESIKLFYKAFTQSPPPLKRVARDAGCNPLVPDSVSRRPRLSLRSSHYCT